jgi:hypothetical protein
MHYIHTHCNGRSLHAYGNGMFDPAAVMCEPLGPDVNAFLRKSIYVTTHSQTNPEVHPHSLDTQLHHMAEVRKSLVHTYNNKFGTFIPFD